MKHLISALFWLLIAISACQKPLEIEFPAVQPRLVAACLFSPDTVFTVRISRTATLNDTADLSINDAQCEIWSNTQKLADLPNIGNGFYQAQTLRPELGTSYTLKISHPQYGAVTAQSSVPKSFPTVLFAEKTDFAVMYNNDPNMEGIAHNKLHLEFRTKPDSLAYYETFLFVKRTLSFDDDYAEEWTNLQLYALDQNILREQILEYDPRILPFSNQNTQTETEQVNLLYMPNWLSGRDGNYSYGKHEVKYVFRHTSPELFNYRKSIIQHSYNNMNELFYSVGDPVQLYTNIQGGYGIFAGYTEFIGVIQDTIDDFK